MIKNCWFSHSLCAEKVDFINHLQNSIDNTVWSNIELKSKYFFEALNRFWNEDIGQRIMVTGQYSERGKRKKNGPRKMLLETCACIGMQYYDVVCGRRAFKTVTLDLLRKKIYSRRARGHMRSEWKSRVHKYINPLFVFGSSLTIILHRY